MLRRWLLLCVVAFTVIAAAAAPRTAPTDTASVAAGAKIFAKYCETCHGKTGKGDGPTGKALNPHPRNFTKASEFKSKNDEDAFKVISKGGASMGLSPLMVAWGSVLKEPQIWQVLGYVRTFAKAATPAPAPAAAPANK